MAKNFIFRQIFFSLVFASSAFCLGPGVFSRNVFLSDADSVKFFENFVENQVCCDYVFSIRLESFSRNSDPVEYEGILLHKNIKGCPTFALEFRVDDKATCRFIFSKDFVWSNFSDTFDAKTPFFDGGLCACNDILLPFLRTCSVRYAGPRNAHGRPVQQFLIPLPEDMCGDGMGYARISIDSSFLQALEIEYLSKNHKLLRSQRVASLKKQNEAWLPKTIELFDVRTRICSKITILHADFDVKLDDKIFTKEFFMKNSFLK